MSTRSRTHLNDRAAPSRRPRRSPAPKPDKAKSSRVHPSALALRAASGALAPPDVLQLQRTIGNRVVRRFATADRTAGRTYRLALDPRARGAYRVRITAVSGGRRVAATLTARGL